VVFGGQGAFFAIVPEKLAPYFGVIVGIDLFVFVKALTTIEQI